MTVIENHRKHDRRPADAPISAAWKDGQHVTRSVQGHIVDLSQGGLRMESPEPAAPGTLVFVESARLHLSGSGRVCHSTPHGAGFMLGLEFCEEMQSSVHLPVDGSADYYEILQISVNAEPDTIRRVYRIMAARYHPDNPQSGDAGRFMLLTKAFQTLSDPQRRAQYDATLRAREDKPLPVFELKEFVDDVAGETNRRLGVLCLLYNQRRNDPDQPGLSLLELEKLMSFPREYLMFTIWYLKEKQFVVQGDDSAFVLTAGGADYVEARSPSDQIVHRLLQSPVRANEHEGADGSGRPPVDAVPLLAARHFAQA